MNDVRLPIKTSREGNKITKVCVEDVYKMINRVQEGMNRAYNNTVDVMDSLHKEIETEDGPVVGEFIIGTGISQPCMKDAFDEEIGSNIAFMKAKLNASIKKHNFLMKALKQWLGIIRTFDEEFVRVESKIIMDLNGIRRHNPEYLKDIEKKLGMGKLTIESDGYEVQEEEA